MDLPLVSIDLGGLDRPILNFRPQLWRHLDRNREILNLDLFWPLRLDEESDSDDGEGEGDNDGDSKGLFPFKDLLPLKTFYNLHYLQLNGMMRSYQPIIWATCWANKGLTKVHLEMALEPTMCEDIVHKHRKIDEKWSHDYLSDAQIDCEYLGAHGDGTLHQEFGEGEYLDQQAMKNGQMEVVQVLPVENMRYLPITHLTLMNFAVDAGPFFRWFDPKKLKEITFLGQCIDTGFSLPENMKTTVKVNSPKPIIMPRFVRPGEVKIVQIKRAKSTSSKGETSAGGLKSKLSQIMPRWGSRSKEKESKEQDKDMTPEATQLERNLSNLGL